VRLKHKHILLWVAVFVLYGVAGTSDYEHERQEFLHYCEMVESGHWPDYKKAFDNCMLQE
jgi:hypothetical protein